MPFSHNLLKVIRACNLLKNGGAYYLATTWS